MACVSAADPERQQKMESVIGVILSDTRLAIYVPVVVRESAPRTTPPSKATAMMDVYRSTAPTHHATSPPKKTVTGKNHVTRYKASIQDRDTGRNQERRSACAASTPMYPVAK